MVVVTTSSNNDYKLIIKIDGHCSENHGEDLVCAGLSAIVTGFCNFLLKEKLFKDVKIKLIEGFGEIKFRTINPKINNCLQVFWEQLLTIYQGNQKYIEMKGDIYDII